MHIKILYLIEKYYNTMNLEKLDKHLQTLQNLWINRPDPFKFQFLKKHTLKQDDLANVILRSTCRLSGLDIDPHLKPIS